MSEKTYHIAVEQATARRPSGHELRERDRERRRRLRATSSDVKEQERRRKRRAQEADSGFREREQVRKQQYRDQHQRPFVGVDGEGGDTGPCASPVFYFDSNGLV